MKSVTWSERLFYFAFLHEGIPELLRNSCSQVQRPFAAGKLYWCPTGSIIAVEKSSEGCFCTFLTISLHIFFALNTDMLKA